MINFLRRTALILTVLSLVLSDISVCFAAQCETLLGEKIIRYYEYDADDITLNLSDAEKQYIKGNIRLENTDLAMNPTVWTLRINGKAIETKSVSAGGYVSFNYSPVETQSYILTFYPSSKKASFYHNSSSVKKIVSQFVFKIEDAVQTVYFMKVSGEDGSAQTKTAVKNASGYFDFGTFTFTAEGQTVSFSLKVNSKTNKAILTRDGKEYTYSLEGTGKYETVYCENLVPQQEIDMDYMASSLEKKTYAQAKSYGSDGRLYTTADVDKALTGSKYTVKLINNKTGLSTNVQVTSFITHWARKEGDGTSVGDGSYNEYTEKVQVVCQWGEDKCSSIRSKYGDENRPFAVYGSNTKYSFVEDYTVLAKVKKYNNISWPSSSWTETTAYNEVESSLSSDYGVLKYSRSKASWGDYGAWGIYNGGTARTCTYTNNCAYETRDAYAYRVRSWGDWSSYIYTAKGDETDTEWKSAYKYSQQKRTWGAWSGYIYTAAQVATCEIRGDDSSCDKESTTRYRKKTGTYSAWSDFTDWAAGSCVSSNIKNCESRTRYAWRSMGSWGAWETTALNVSCSTSYAKSGGTKGLNLLVKDCKTENQTRYRTRTIESFDYSDYGGYKTSSYGYVGQCLSRTGEHEECGIKSYTYTFGSYKDSKYGDYTSKCESKTENTTCKVYNTDGSVCGYTYGSWGSYSSWSTGSCSATTTKDCDSKTQTRYRTRTSQYKRCSLAGCETWNTKTQYKSSCSCIAGTAKGKTCTGSWADSKTACTINKCTSRKCSYESKSVNTTCKTYKRSSLCGTEYGSWGSYSSWSDSSCSGSNTKECDSRTLTRYRTRTATAKACASAGCNTWNTKTTYSCPTKRTTNYKSCTSYNCPTTADPNYSAWSSWSSWSTASCTASAYTDCDSKTVNYKRTRSWNDWTGYTLSSAPVSSEIDYLAQNQVRSQSRTITWTAWTDYVYSSCSEDDTTLCDSALRYRKRTLGDWGTASSYIYDYSQECADSNLCKQSGKTMWAKRSLGEWSDTVYGKNSSGVYLYSTCEDSQTKQCLTQKQMRTKSRTMGEWSSWITAASPESITRDYENYAYKYKYSNGVREVSEEKGTSTVKGAGTMYISDASESGSKQVEAVRTAQKSYTASSRMTVSEISEFSKTLGTEAAQASTLSGYISSSSTVTTGGSPYVSKTYWEEHTGTNYAAGSAAVSQFQNEKRFIPYIFITRHYRAVNAKFYIEGYDEEGLDISTSLTLTTKEGERKQDNIPLSVKTVDYCDVYPEDSGCQKCIQEPDYCTLHPDADECYCKAHPKEYPRCASYCEAYPDEVSCICAADPTDPVCIKTSRDTAVIYYDYRDPLENYTKYTMPANWAGYAALVDELKNSDLSEYQIQVTLTKADLAAMREWLSVNSDKVGTGAMIKAFSYIFTTDDPEIKSLISQ